MGNPSKTRGKPEEDTTRLPSVQGFEYGGSGIYTIRRNPRRYSETLDRAVGGYPPNGRVRSGLESR
jgi:hypothetical protein